MEAVVWLQVKLMDRLLLVGSVLCVGYHGNRFDPEVGIPACADGDSHSEAAVRALTAKHPRCAPQTKAQNEKRQTTPARLGIPTQSNLCHRRHDMRAVQRKTSHGG